jgi:hypothetical protein
MRATARGSSTYDVWRQRVLGRADGRATLVQKLKDGGARGNYRRVARQPRGVVP